ncbi:class I SAM-dependent methyltransferase [Mycobacterium marinum]|uniref:class I SAM-dependent methyltransferase n=1 Tax=Mycobacterium marinum TaxID=1781 RepID=UPI00035881EF|nr:class I SAM-dependent methyltransferase [Mycobacterium marinum]EPQ76128.1 O-antigen biosynthesis protein [Mycobacterium marinum MB2]MDC8974205.1 class I SAM-dependent methyltransferase [Mycobacterium marinum]MDC9006839.1 class I SAM-dependent methyltransferase [Mycobacterium marinum]QQW35489.1 class I SAM-dependent methyltransferase [Mycobacterium marinum]RFZ57028.1 Trans-aconitate 2-methyltransferase [Mycobacterium marinum]
MHIARESKSVTEYYRPTQTEILRFVPTTAQRILDLHCGQGTLGATLKERTGAEVWGIESDSQAAQQASAAIDRVLVGTVAERIAELPDNHFDVIVCNDVLERLVDPTATLKQLRCKLTSEGVVVAAVPNIRFLPALSKVLFRKDFPQEDFGTFDRTYIRFFTRRSLVRLFKTSGFGVRRIAGINAWNGTIGVALAVLTLGYFADGRYLQYACIASPSASKPTS